MTAKETDELSGIETTGHEWDGIKELNNPLPKWWLWTFYATIIFSIGYMIYYPSIPLIEGANAGLSGYSSRAEVAKEIAAAREAQSGINDKISSNSLDAIASDDEMRRFAVSAGQSAYKVHCVQCHGSGAQGAPGYPNLNDDEWIWGGDLEAIYTSIAHGIRNDQDDDARYSEMPAFGSDELLESDDIAAATNYVLKISGQDHDEALLEQGAQVYADNCAACHGEDGTGDREQGAPNLTDAIWLYGGTPEEIQIQLSAPRHGVMPPWIGRLGEVTVKQLAVYVHGLGGGEDSTAEVAGRHHDRPDRQGRDLRCRGRKLGGKPRALRLAQEDLPEAGEWLVPPAEMVDHGGHPRYLLHHAVAALESRRLRAGPGGSG